MVNPSPLEGDTFRSVLICMSNVSILVAAKAGEVSPMYHPPTLPTSKVGGTHPSMLLLPRVYLPSSAPSRRRRRRGRLQTGPSCCPPPHDISHVMRGERQSTQLDAQFVVTSAVYFPCSYARWDRGRLSPAATHKGGGGRRAFSPDAR